jgi:dimethylhistidine N-methyltransferase
MPDASRTGYRILDRSRHDPAAEREAVVAGLLARPARIAPKYFYDELGCALYGAICKLPEYYPTRTEIALFQAHRAEVAEAVGRGRQLVDLGSGDCCKAESWMPFLEPVRYIAVDIAAAELERSLARLSLDHAGVDMVGVVTDFAAGLAIEDVLDARPVTFFYPGSSIGNFTPPEARDFLASIRAHCRAREGGLLIGVDGKKDKSRLDAAYDDRLGVTAAFNRNVLLHLNRRFGFDFALDGYEHLGFYNEAAGRIEMHLQALRDQVVQLGATERRFARGERIHTENSYKYSRQEFARLLEDAGFGAVRHWSAPAEAYHLFYAA